MPNGGNHQIGDLGDLSAIPRGLQEEQDQGEQMDPDAELLLGEPEWGPDTPLSPLEPLETRDPTNRAETREMVSCLLEYLMRAAQQGHGEPPEQEEEDTGL